MTARTVLDDLQERLSGLLAQTLAADIERNAKALLAQGFAKLELATREEFEVQSEVLARTRARLEALEKRVAELESRLAQTAQT